MKKLKAVRRPAKNNAKLLEGVGAALASTLNLSDRQILSEFFVGLENVGYVLVPKVPTVMMLRKVPRAKQAAAIESWLRMMSFRPRMKFNGE